MREWEHGDIRSRTRSPPQRPLPRGRAHSPFVSCRHCHCNDSPLSHRHHGVEETLSTHSRYLSGLSREEGELSPPIHGRRERTSSPPSPPKLFERPPPPYLFKRSSPPYHLEAKEQGNPQSFRDAHFASSSPSVMFDRRSEVLVGEGCESKCYAADRYTDEYRRDRSLQNKLGLDERSSFGDSASTKFHWKHLLVGKRPASDTKLSHGTSISGRISRGGEVSEIELDLKPNSMKGANSVRTSHFPGYLNTSNVAGDKCGFCDVDSVAELGLGGDSTWNHGKLSAREPPGKLEASKLDYVDDLPSAASTGKIHAPVHPYRTKDSFSGYIRGIDHNEYGQMLPVSSCYKELLDSSPAIKIPMENVGSEFANTGERRNEGSDFGSLPVELYYKNLVSVGEKYDLQGTFETSPEVRLADKIEVFEDSGAQYSRGSCPLDDQDYASGISYMKGQHEYDSSNGTIHLNHSREEYLDYEPSLMVDNDCYGEGDESWPYGDDFDSFSLSEHDERLPDPDWSPWHRLTKEELGSVSPSEKIVKRRHGFDKRRLGYNFTASVLNYGNEGRSDENANRLHGRLQNGRLPSKKRRPIPADYLFSDHISKTMKRNWRKPMAPAARDVKMRLRPTIRNPRTPYRRDKKMRLSQASLNDGLSHDSQEGESRETMAESNANHNLDSAKAEAPEGSEEFAQLVNGAFLKFVKLLNENPAQRRNYTEQGRFGTLKCGICGRKSKEFLDTLDLTTHALTFRATGSRAEHLGLHKALCILMGWSSAVGPNGTWVRQALPDADALAQRKDLVIWPPMVIIHNSSIANPATDERVILSVEEMKAILREMGFGWDKAKVMHGKRANQSIVVVSFHGTFSGLWEAESLDKLFMDKGRGRIEFDQVSSNQNGTGKAPENKVSVLYGYMAIAEDLDKLDYKMKKRCVVRSRKEIQEMVNVQL